MTQEWPVMAREFPDFDQSTLPPIPAGAIETSWRNDQCPSFRLPSGLYLFVDYLSRDLREFPESFRLCVKPLHASGGTEDCFDVESDYAALYQWAADAFPVILARNFDAHLRHELGAKLYAETVQKNRTDAYSWPVCASHDECDANMVMLAAFEEILGEGPDIGDAAVMETWGDAWKEWRMLTA
jgi:hypothetical protein